MVWRILFKPKPKQTTLDDVMCAIERLRKELQMDFTQLNTAIQTLGTDVGLEIEAAKAAILAAQAGDPTALVAAVDALNNIDAAVKAATSTFTPVPPPPTV